MNPAVKCETCWEGEEMYWEMAKGEKIRVVTLVSVGLGLDFCKPNMNIFVRAVA